METNKTKAARGANSAALDTSDRQSNHTDRAVFAQCMKDTATLLFQSAHEDALLIGTFEGIEKRRMGSHILCTLRGMLAHSQVARAMVWR